MQFITEIFDGTMIELQYDGSLVVRKLTFGFRVTRKTNIFFTYKHLRIFLSDASRASTFGGLIFLAIYIWTWRVYLESMGGKKSCNINHMLCIFLIFNSEPLPIYNYIFQWMNKYQIHEHTKDSVMVVNITTRF